MNKNNDLLLAEAVTNLQALAAKTDAVMREDGDMIRHAALLEQAAREMGWRALFMRCRNLEVV